jgi:hypothetical protein
MNLFEDERYLTREEILENLTKEVMNDDSGVFGLEVEDSVE